MHQGKHVYDLYRQYVSGVVEKPWELLTIESQDRWEMVAAGLNNLNSRRPFPQESFVHSTVVIKQTVAQDEGEAVPLRKKHSNGESKKSRKNLLAGNVHYLDFKKGDE